MRTIFDLTGETRYQFELAIFSTFNLGKRDENVASDKHRKLLGVQR